MQRSDIADLLQPIDRLYSEIVQFVPQDTQRIQFRSDLAGLLVVAIAASYENCVKEVLIAFCGSHSPVFGFFASKQYDRMNSRIAVADLKGYSRLFGDEISLRFRERLRGRRDAILNRTGKNISDIYDQLLQWRHQYAHSGQQNTTIEEAYAAHTFAKRVVYVFADAII